MDQILMVAARGPMPLTGQHDATLADVFAYIEADPTLSATQRRDMLSALRRLSIALGEELRHIPALPLALRDRINAVLPAATEMSRRRFLNIRSRTLAAIERSGIRVLRGRAAQPLAPAWELLRLALPTPPAARAGLSRLMSFCTAWGIKPDEVTDQTFAQFRAALDADSLVRNISTVHRTAAILWNQAANTISGWPEIQVTVPSASRRYALEWSDFPSSFAADAKAFLTRLGTDDPFADDYVPAVRPSTVRVRRKQILQLATGLILSGVPHEQVTGLADLVGGDHPKRILRVLLDRTGGKPSVHLHAQALLLKTIARNWVRADAATTTQLTKFARNLAVKKGGMTAKNRARLRQLDLPENVRKLLNLPKRVFANLDKLDQIRRTDALRAMRATAIGLLKVAPMRIDCLTGIEIDRHLVTVRTGKQSKQYISVPGEETKTGQPLEVPLSEATSRMLTRYCEVYRPHLADRPNMWLFPNGSGGRRDTVSFSVAISEFIARETGLTINVHLFRHIAAKLYLRVHPGDYETIRRLLGHTSLNTTLRSYIDCKDDAAFERFSALIGTMGDELAVDERPKSARQGGLR